MATSEHERGQKTESVQFWLCIAMVSLALHSGLIFTLQRWAKVAILQPDDAGPIAVELVDAPDAVAPNVESEAIAAVPQKPEMKSEAQPQAKPEPEPEVVQKPDPKPEPQSPIIPPVEPKKKPAIDSSPKPKKSPIASPKKPSNPSPSVPPKLPSPGSTPNPNPPLPGQPIGDPGSEDGQGEILLQVGVKENSVQLSAQSKVDFAGQGKCKVDAPKKVNFPGQYPLQNGQDLVINITWLLDIARNEVSGPQPSPKVISPNLEGIQKKMLEDIARNIRDQSQPEVFDLTTSASEPHRAKFIECEMTVTVTR